MKKNIKCINECVSQLRSHITNIKKLQLSMKIIFVHRRTLYTYQNLFNLFYRARE